MLTEILTIALFAAQAIFLGQNGLIGNSMPGVATPVISPTSGAYTSPQTVTSSDATPGATICYTVDSSTPTGVAGSCTHGTTYSGGVSQSIPSTVKAVGTLAGYTTSSVATNVYTLSGGGTTYTAASCSESAVQAAITAEQVSPADGDIISIPSGDCTWTTALNFTQTNSITFQGQTTVTGDCTPTACTAADNTIIEDNYNYTGGSGFMNFNTILGKSLRVTGITFKWSPSQTSVTNNGEIQFDGYTQALRWDHCHLLQPSGATNGIVIASTWNYILGVADHNVIDMTSDDSNWIRVGMPSYDGDSEGLGNKSWADATGFGSANFFFLENNTFNWNGSYADPSTHFAATNDCNAGGRMVLRYNTIDGLFLTQMHEMEGNFRGCRALEDYMNIRVGSSTPDSVYFATALGMRMGTSLVWGDTVTGFDQVANFTNDRTNTGHAFGETTPVVSPSATTGWGYCGTPAGQSSPNLGPSAYDFATGSNGYPCADQVGRGISSLVVGTFPTKYVSGSIQWVGNALEPVVVWDNTYTAPSGAGGSAAYATSNDTTTIQNNRDYYLELPNYSDSSSFNGTAGVGHGTLVPTNSSAYSGAPTCTSGVYYWDSTTTTLYQCQAGTWASYYTPYTYPHPLDF